MADVDGFLKELTELTLKYGIQIKGCGCCGSPFLMNMNDEHQVFYGDELDFDPDTQHYKIEKK